MVFKLKQTGAQPELKEAPKINPNMGQRAAGEEPMLPKMPDPIGASLKLRKAQPGEQITAVVPSDKKVIQDNVFKLSLKGSLPVLQEAPKSDPSLGQRTEGLPDPNIPKKPCAIEVSLALRKKEGTVITAVVKNPENKIEEVGPVFELKLVGDPPKLKEVVELDPSLGKRIFD